MEISIIDDDIFDKPKLVIRTIDSFSTFTVQTVPEGHNTNNQPIYWLVFIVLCFTCIPLGMRP